MAFTSASVLSRVFDEQSQIIGQISSYWTNIKVLMASFIYLPAVTVKKINLPESMLCVDANF